MQANFDRDNHTYDDTSAHIFSLCYYLFPSHTRTFAHIRAQTQTRICRVKVRWVFFGDGLHFKGTIFFPDPTYSCNRFINSVHLYSWCIFCLLILVKSSSFLFLILSNSNKVFIHGFLILLHCLFFLFFLGGLWRYKDALDQIAV